MVPGSSTAQSPAALLILAAALAMSGLSRFEPSHPVPAPLPSHLHATGLYANASHAAWKDPIAPGLIAFAPQYTLWSDGSQKRRWLSLPAGTAVDASNPAAWEFPPGTRFWKEFAFDGPVETRMIERLADGSWRYASYVWNADGSDAVLAPLEGIRAVPSHGGPLADYAIPSTDDCRGCHEGASVPPLGFTALQLSPDRDPLAPHAPAGLADLRSLSASGVIKHLPGELLQHPPRVDASTPVARAALGYLQANCGHCHNRGEGRVPVTLSLAQEWRGGRPGSAPLLSTLIDKPARYQLRGHTDTVLVAPGDAASSLVVLRMESRDPRVQMPPIGTRTVDPVALDLVKRWIAELQPSSKEAKP